MKREARIVVTGGEGFIGKNLRVRLGEQGYTDVVAVGRGDDLAAAVVGAEAIFHLAGANRPSDPADFYRVNRDLAAELIDAVAAAGVRPLILFASSAKAGEDNDYGRSKAAGEAAKASKLAALKRIEGLWTAAMRAESPVDAVKLLGEASDAVRESFPGIRVGFEGQAAKVYTDALGIAA